MSTPKVSVVIPAYNEVKYLPACITALNNQTLKDFEVIVVTRGDDGTQELCRQAGWKVVIQKSTGVSSARLEGFAQAAAPIIASTDADSSPTPQWIAQITSAFTDPQVVMVYGPSLLDSPSKYYQLLSFIGALFQRAFHLLGKDHIFGMNFAVTQKAYITAGGFDPTKITGEDADLGFRVAPLGKTVFLPSLTVLTSPRRLKHYGLLSFTAHHLKNLFTMLFFRKSSSNFTPIR